MKIINEKGIKLIDEQFYWIRRVEVNRVDKTRKYMMEPAQYFREHFFTCGSELELDQYAGSRPYDPNTEVEVISKIRKPKYGN